MIKLRPARERGHFDFGWLDTNHTFSFGDYYDPENMGYRTLRVINEDVVQPGQGFGTHGHRDMEIVTYILEGSLQHKDSMGNGSVITPGEVQRMSAGTGVKHSEFNASADTSVHLLQIWILPAKKGIAPGYEQRRFDLEKSVNQWTLIASPDGREGSVTIHQDACIYAARMTDRNVLSFGTKPGRGYWLHTACGAGSVNGVAMSDGDGAAIENESKIEITGSAEESEFLLFELN